MKRNRSISNMIIAEASDICGSVILDLDKDNIPKECYIDLLKLNRYIKKLLKIARKLDKLS